MPTCAARAAVLALLATGAACTAGEPAGAPDGGVRPGTPASPHAQLAQVMTGAPAGEDLCALLPDEGACAVACDPDALAAFLPAGTCGTFLCALTDGRSVVVSACRPPD